MSNEYHPNKAPKIAGLAAVSVAVVAALLFVMLHQQPTGTATTTTPSTISTPVATDSTSTPATSSSAATKDGTYTASANYDVPHGETNTIAVTLTVKNGVVSSVGTQDQYQDHDSARYISQFKSEISSEVVGKTLQEAGVARVSGASDTSSGFDDALQQIAAKASA